MYCTKEPDEGAPRLPVVYSQGYAYVSVIHVPGLDGGSSKGSKTAAKSGTPPERPKNEPPLGPPLAVVTLAALLGPLVGDAAFVFLQAA
jgi:hypothetical protein